MKEKAARCWHKVDSQLPHGQSWQALAICTGTCISICVCHSPAHETHPRLCTGLTCPPVGNSPFKKSARASLYSQASVWTSGRTTCQDLCVFPNLVLTCSLPVFFVPGETMKHTHLPSLPIFFLLVAWTTMRVRCLGYAANENRNFNFQKHWGEKALTSLQCLLNCFNFWTFF